ncbi:hypothetical protein PAPHI01_1745 [Pancytospora philotis]|nr:hypothetical protein PAPHI01_1745 [Pancytospora philotis]
MSLPDAFYSLTSLKKLDLAHNLLSAVSERVARMDGLEALSLRNNLLESLPNELFSLASLRTLDISGNRIRDIPCTGINATLESLTMRGMELDRPPAGLGNLVGLTSLDLCTNKLSEIPSAVAHLKTLERLQLASNSIEELYSVPINSSIRFLNLSSNSLKALPDALANFKSLAMLDASNNGIKKIDAGIFELKGLKVLILSHNKLSYIDRGFVFSDRNFSIPAGRMPHSLPKVVGAPKLEALILANNSLLRLPSGIFQLPKLKKLDMRHNMLTHLPWVDPNLTLEELYADNNRISSLPDYFHTLLMLRVLSLSNNRMEKLPMWLLTLTHLTELRLKNNFLQRLPTVIATPQLSILDLSYNQLQSLEEGVADLRALTRLDVRVNSIRSLPQRLLWLVNLEYVNLQNNVLEELPPSINLNSALTELDASANKLCAIPGDYFRHRNLRKLRASQNRITGIDIADGIEPNVSLKIMDISSNHIQAVPDNIRKLTRLEVLDLSSNRIERFGIRLCTLSFLRELLMADNRIAEVPSCIGALKELVTLDLRKNALSTVPCEVFTLGKLRVLRLDENRIADLPMPALLGATELRTLSLSKNRLVAVPKEIACLGSLSELSLGWNQIQALPDEMRMLKSMRKLDISHNRLRVVPACIRSMRSLETLDLSGNLLTDLPSWIAKLMQCQELSVSHNRLAALPRELGALPGLVILRAASNGISTVDELFEGSRIAKATSIDLSYNEIAALPKMEKFHKLGNFNISGNRLTRLPDDLLMLRSIVDLNAENNHLEAVPESICIHSKLRSIKLANNGLLGIPRSWAALEPRLQLLDLRGNPLRADSSSNQMGADELMEVFGSKLRTTKSIDVRTVRECLESHRRCPWSWNTNAFRGLGGVSCDAAAVPDSAVLSAWRSIEDTYTLDEAGHQRLTEYINVLYGGFDIPDNSASYLIGPRRDEIKQKLGFVLRALSSGSAGSDTTLIILEELAEAVGYCNDRQQHDIALLYNLLSTGGGLSALDDKIKQAVLSSFDTACAASLGDPRDLQNVHTVAFWKWEIERYFRMERGEPPLHPIQNKDPFDGSLGNAMEELFARFTPRSAAEVLAGTLNASPELLNDCYAALDLLGADRDYALRVCRFDSESDYESMIPRGVTVEGALELLTLRGYLTIS